VPFRARLQSVDAAVSGLEWLVPGKGDLMRPMHYSDVYFLDDVARSRPVKLDPVPGVGVLIITGELFDLTPGTPMTWVTWDDTRKP
jgi:hypothetical protein